MWIEAELVLSSYKPLKLEKGMLFVRMNGEYLEMYEYDGSRYDRDDYMGVNGHPVEAQLFELTPANPCSNQLATHNEIGWIDEGEDSEDMHEITIDDFNIILQNKMRCKVQCIDSPSMEMKIPVYDEEKVIIRLIEEEEE